MCLPLDRLIAFFARIDRVERGAWDRASAWAILVLAVIAILAVL